MSQSVETVVREHLRANDHAQEAVEWAEIVVRFEASSGAGRVRKGQDSGLPRELTDLSSRRRMGLLRGLLVAAAGAVVAIALLVLVPLLVGASGTSPADQPDVTPIVRPPWSMAIRLPVSAFPIGPRESFDDFVSDAESWVGVDVAVVELGTEDAWVEALGGPIPDSFCDSACDPGIVVFASSSDALEAVYQNELFGWYGTPREFVVLSPNGADQLSGRSEERATYLAGYMEDVSGRFGPDPAFDTSQLGVELVLMPVVSEPASEATFVVVISGTDVTAELRFPSIVDTESNSVGQERRITLNGSVEHTVTQRSAVGADSNRISTDPTQGLGVEIIDVIVWDGGIAFGIAGLPANSSVVATELPGGILLWQIPVSGIAYFTAEGSFGDYIDRRGAPPFTVYDSEGNVIHVNR